MTAQWFSARAGDDICIIPYGSYQPGDTLYIVVICLQDCQFNFKIELVTE
jgi:hypothetical protein